jgi:hypothetical protein
MSRVCRVSRPNITARAAPCLPPLDVRKALAGFADITAVADEFRDMVTEQAPELLDRLPPKKPPVRSTKRRKR